MVKVVTSCCRKRRMLMLQALGMRLLTRLLLLVCSLSLVSLLFLSRCGLNVEPEVQLEPGTGKYTRSLYRWSERHSAPNAFPLADLATSAEPGARLSPLFVLHDSGCRQHQRLNQFMACFVTVRFDLYVLSLVDLLFFCHLECISKPSWVCFYF